ncbi:MAG: ABC transporter ATP-binding protein [Thermoguttaceae bacterium]|nr:ABC transporter ATP-binding protein [Thermoguttaceae bacterium]MDW8078708.1 ABC transporter ATP-binding protein [Thermoguttaceae bacterium]
MSQPILEVVDLKTYFYTDEGVAKAVDGVSLTIPRGETVGLVGESGCGKSMTALSIMRLVPPPGRIVAGKVILYDDNQAQVLTDLPEREMRKIRGQKISMIFQEPMTSLNPVFTIGYQIAEAILLHQPNVSRREAWDLAVDMLRKVHIADPEQAAESYPHQFAGGMRQRAMIAMALACQPKLLIADEPTTALDVTIQAQILDLLRLLQSAEKLSILLITHDLGIVAEMASQLAVMYAGQIVEKGPVERVFNRQYHPYTYLLLRSRPSLGLPKDRKLPEIAGEVPKATAYPGGCRFHPRCPFAEPVCREVEPELLPVEETVAAKCHFAGKLDFEAWSQRAVTPGVAGEK